jgi:hypothetical protein
LDWVPALDIKWWEQKAGQGNIIWVLENYLVTAIENTIPVLEFASEKDGS